MPFSTTHALLVFTTVITTHGYPYSGVFPHKAGVDGRQPHILHTHAATGACELLLPILCLPPCFARHSFTQQSDDNEGVCAALRNELYPVVHSVTCSVVSRMSCAMHRVCIFVVLCQG
jgi:hypothetical protein